jgi:hypothetical protein
VYVVGAPSFAVGETSSDVVVASGLTVRPSIGLDEPAVGYPAAGTNTALTRGVDAGNAIRQTLVTLWPVGSTGWLEHALIGCPPFSNVTAPDGAQAGSLEVTVAIRVAAASVTTALGETTRVVAVGAVTMLVGAEPMLALTPSTLVAVSWTTIHLPTSLGDAA